MIRDDAVELPGVLLAWLTRDDHEVAGWAPEPPLDELRCHPDLVERLEQAARPVRGSALVWVRGGPVIHHRAGPPIAFARGTSLLVVRSALPPGALATSARTVGLDASWVHLDPWAADVAFAHTLELLRMHVRRAYDYAEAGEWP